MRQAADFTVHNNVGAVLPRLEGFVSLTDDDWEWALTINFLAAARVMRAAIPHMLDRPGAAIVTISSVNAFLPDPGVIDYSAAKGALTNLCKSLSKELGPGIRVNTISPGPVRTDLWLGGSGVAATVGEASDMDPGEIVRRQEAQASTGRFTYPSEIADVALFRASDRSANVTGSELLIDGGLVDTLSDPGPSESGTSPDFPWSAAFRAGDAERSVACARVREVSVRPGSTGSDRSTPAGRSIRREPESE